jgi:hypothetical protein
MVYHYTTIETFYNMLATYKSSEDKNHLEFWASSIFNQNDKEELSLTAADIMPVVKDIPVLTDLHHAAMIVGAVAYGDRSLFIAVNMKVAVADQHASIGEGAFRSVRDCIAKLVHHL